MAQRWTGVRSGLTTASPRELTHQLLACTWEDPRLEVAEAAGMGQGVGTGIATIMRGMTTTGTEGVQVPTGDAEVQALMEGGVIEAGAGATVLAGGTTAPGDTESSNNLCCPHSLVLAQCSLQVFETPFWL